MKKGTVLLGVLAGMAAGAALGVLFAPDKGTATRKKILKKKDDFVDEVEDKFNHLVDNVNGKFDAFKKETTRLVERVKTPTEMHQEVNANKN
ncbi:MAG: YtxH domain-containing protein [Saprospiraceae bacterium]